MSFTVEQQKELERFPPQLRALIDAELAAGNSIVEFGHGFPAPPAGAYLKLANKVGTRPRASGDGISFYERNMPSYSGEFTDSKRFFFVLEPPNPPPPEPDMNAIRAALNAKSDPLVQLANRPTGSSVKIALGESSLEEVVSQPSERTKNTAPLPSPMLFTETPTSSKWILYFEDPRPPHEVQFALERELRTLFTPTMDNDKLTMHAKAIVIGTRYVFELRFEAALFFRNCYSLRVEASWADQPATSHDYSRKTFDSWFKLWTRDLMPANPPKANAGSEARYRKLCDTALQAEKHLDSVAAIQQAIIAKLKRGGSFGTAHKEGGTNIYWKGGQFVRSDYGDYPDEQKFTAEAEFLKMLYRFLNWDVARHAGTEKLSEFDTWKLILRQMRTR